MDTTILIATLGYIISSGLLFARVKGYHPSWSKSVVMASTAIAVLAHAALLTNNLLAHEPVQMGLGLSLSFAGWLSATIVLFSSMRHPVEILGFFIFPMSLLGLWLVVLLPTPYELGLAMSVHVLLSLVAYSFLTIAAAQAVLVKMQERRLKARQWSGLFGALPPLETMESILLTWLWIGFIALTLALLSGLFFIDNFFAQQIAHKTFFALLSWMVLAVLLWGRHRFGWRGKKAARIVLWGYTLLVLGYVGSQFIIEVLLS